MNEIICGACGTIAQDWQSFCTECGVSIEKQPEIYLNPIPVIGKYKYPTTSGTDTIGDEGHMAHVARMMRKRQVAATISLLRMASYK